MGIRVRLVLTPRASPEGFPNPKARGGKRLINPWFLSWRCPELAEGSKGGLKERNYGSLNDCGVEGNVVTTRAEAPKVRGKPRPSNNHTLLSNQHNVNRLWEQIILILTINGIPPTM